ncbi:hypothetical protein [uncultured Lacinutrix sp.]|uniref:hypothetical protein n=1 Tax=uncultured Lacinutrix sp. TaxID=574032 RepID=UPI00262847C6|nr:hypothetical protein [uncultured Lacinutrix sp.]
MNRDYHLIYCKICTNKAIDLKRGTYCSLTNKIADFNDNCENFNKNEVEVSKIKERIKKKKEALYSLNEIEKLLSNNKPKYSDSSKFKRSQYKYKEETLGLIFKKDNFDDYLTAIAVFTMYLVFLMFNYDKGFDLSYDSTVTIVSVFFLIVFFYSYKKAFYHKYKPEITVLENGLLIKDKTIFWEDIVEYGIEYHTGEYSISNLVIFTMSSGVIRVTDLSEIKAGEKDIIQIIKLNLQ